MDKFASLVQFKQVKQEVIRRYRNCALWSLLTGREPISVYFIFVNRKQQ